MAVVFTEGFGMSNNINDLMKYGLILVNNSSNLYTGGPFGDNYISTYSGSNRTIKLRGLKTPLTTFTFGARFGILTTGNSYSTLLLMQSSANNAQLSFLINTTNPTNLWIVRGYSNSSSTVATVTLPTPLSVSSWNYLEFQVTISTTVGSITVRENGVVVYTGTNLNTANDTSNLNVQYFSLGDVNNPYAQNGATMAHVYVTDTTSPNAGFLGDTRVLTVFPNANASVAFTPNGLAANYSNAAKYPPVPATDYNSSNTIGATDLFTIPALPAGYNEVVAVASKSLMYLATAGSRVAANQIKSGTVTENGANIYVPSSSAVNFTDIFNTDPNTSSAWTTASVNAMNIGYTIIS